MRRSVGTFSFVVGLLVSSAAGGQAIPNWSLGEICKGDSHREACMAFERNAYSHVSGLWPTIPPEITKTCLDRINALERPSYRVLRDCLEGELFKAHRAARKRRGIS